MYKSQYYSYLPLIYVFIKILNFELKYFINCVFFLTQIFLFLNNQSYSMGNICAELIVLRFCCEDFVKHHTQCTTCVICIRKKHVLLRF